MNTPPDLSIMFEWIGFFLVGAAGAVMISSSIIGARRMSILTRNAAPDDAFAVANNRVGRILGLGFLQLILGVAFYALGAWLGRP